MTLATFAPLTQASHSYLSQAVPLRPGDKGGGRRPVGRPTELGNQATQQHLRVGAIQPRVAVSQPGDPYEREADRVAEQVLRLTAPAGTRVPSVIRRAPDPAGTVQRCGGVVHAGCACASGQLEEADQKLLQAKAAPGHQVALAPDVRAQVHSLRGGGQPLPATLRAFFEPRFGYDFSQVRIHTDGGAAASARAINALAYTVGRDIAFGAGQYAPGTATGQRLIAHELTHVVQQAAVVARKPALADEGPYVPGEMSERYWALTDDERAAVNTETDRLFQEKTGITRKLDPGSPGDKDLVNDWLRVRDEVMAKRLAPCPPITCPFAPTQPAAPSPPAPPREPQLRDPHIPSRGLCRGACGSDCPSTCRPVPDIVLCVSAGGCHATCTYRNVLSCATADGCRHHDECYDVCAATTGEMDLCGCPVRACAFGTTDCANPCHCRCDYGCCSVHGNVQCGRWSQGSTSGSDAWFNYADTAGAGPSMPGACPP